MRILITLLVLFFISACSKHSTYTVKQGDSLSTIAKRHGISVTELGRLNRISNPNHIKAGQILKIRGSAKVNSSQKTYAKNNKTTSQPIQNSQPTNYSEKPIPKIAGWHKPTQGNVVRSFNPSLPGHKGIQITGQPNQAIYSANNGNVVYAGQGSSGYGQLVIIKHSNNVYTAYGYLSLFRLKKGNL